MTNGSVRPCLRPNSLSGPEYDSAGLQCSVLLLHIRNVGSCGVELQLEAIELQRLVFNLLGVGIGGGVGIRITRGRLWPVQVLNFLHRLPWLRSLLSRVVN